MDGRHLHVTGKAAFAAASIAAALCLGACGASMQMKKPEQGLEGRFSVYGPPPQADCTIPKLQADRDSCRHANQRIIEEPYAGSLLIRNLSTSESLHAALNAQGRYRQLLTPGQYEVCLEGECSDPLEVRMGEFSTYGQRIPKPAPETAKAAEPKGTKSGSSSEKIP